MHGLPTFLYQANYIAAVHSQDADELENNLTGSQHRTTPGLAQTSKMSPPPVNSDTNYTNDLGFTRSVCLLRLMLQSPSDIPTVTFTRLNPVTQRYKKNYQCGLH